MLPTRQITLVVMLLRAVVVMCLSYLNCLHHSSYSYFKRFFGGVYSNLFVRYRVKHAVNVLGIFYINWDWMRVTRLIFTESHLKFLHDKLVHHTPVRFNKACSYVFHECSKTFIQPKIVPPFHSYEIPKPLKRNSFKVRWWPKTL